jgi:hypothetical protein
MTNNKINVTQPIPVTNGGLGVSSLTAFAPIMGGNTSTSSIQSVASIGTSGQILISNGLSTLPTFQSISPSSSITLIQTLTASSSATLIFNTGISSAGIYMFVLNGVVPATGSGTINMQVSNDGGTTWASSGYLSGGQRANANTWNNSTSTTDLFTSMTMENTSGYGLSSVLYIGNINIGGYSQISGQMTGRLSSSMSYGIVTGISGITGVNAFKWYSTVGNLSTGTISLYYLGS